VSAPASNATPAPAPQKQRRWRRRVGDRLFEWFAPALVALIIRALAWSLRFRANGIDNYQIATEAGRPILFVFWHQDWLNAALALQRLRMGRRVAVMISHSRDGDKLASVVHRIGLDPVRGSSSRGAVRGIIAMVRYLTDPARKRALAALALDGPRGPRYQAKPGGALLARRAGALIIPVRFELGSQWTLGSWDRSRIAKPFSRWTVNFMPAIDPTPFASDDEALTLVVADALNGHAPTMNAA